MKTHREEALWWWRQQWEGRGHKPRNHGHQKLAEARTDPPLEASEKAQPCPHPDFSLLAPGAVREPGSVA